MYSLKILMEIPLVISAYSKCYNCKKKENFSGRDIVLNTDNVLLQFSKLESNDFIRAVAFLMFTYFSLNVIMEIEVCQ